jgi:PD-(D/E)XK nuclease superfamily protein
MTNRGIDIKHPKQRGEWAELRFMARAAEHGLCITKPWGEMSHYDFAIEYQGHFLRVQVKSTKRKRKGHYVCNVLTSGKPYKMGQIDFVAAYVIPEDVWYIIPVDAFCGRWYIHFSLDLKTSKYGQYREAWHLLRGKPAKSRATAAGR